MNIMFHEFKIGRRFKSVDEYKQIMKYLEQNFPGVGTVVLGPMTIIVPTVEDEIIFRLRFG